MTAAPLERPPAVVPLTRFVYQRGRRVAYTEHGDPHGIPVFLLHGMPGSRLTYHSDARLAREAGLRIIAPDRPGFGLSEFVRGRTIVGYTASLLALADALAIDTFALLGFSAGGPYALAVAQAAPQRVRCVHLVSTLGPMTLDGAHNDQIAPTALLLAMATGWPVYLPPLVWSLARQAAGNQRATVNRLYRALPDRELMVERPDLRNIIVATNLEAFRGGPLGVLHELRLLTQHWGFEIEDTPQRVVLWHGDEDVLAPARMGHALQAALTDCRATYFPHHGHTMLWAMWKDILHAVRADAG